MSYSRWANSHWYTFWNCSSGDKMEDQILSIWTGSLDLDIPYDQIKKYTYHDIIDLFDCTESEAKECMGYIHSFLEDVERDFMKDEVGR